MSGRHAEGRYADTAQWRPAHQELFRREPVSSFLGSVAEIDDGRLVIMMRFRLVHAVSLAADSTSSFAVITRFGWPAGLVLSRRLNLVDADKPAGPRLTVGAP